MSEIQKILNQKELYQYRLDPEYNFRLPGTFDELAEYYLKYTSYQLFVENYMNPNTDVKRLILQWMTGVGKTMGGIIIAWKFIQVYQAEYQKKYFQSLQLKKKHHALNIESPTVFVVGFGGTQKAFVRDLLKYPELGIVTQLEKEQLENLRKISKSGLEMDVKQYKDYYNRLKRRITTKQLGGFFKFYGYQELVNRLFSGTVTLIELEKRVMDRAKTKAGSDTSNDAPAGTLEDELIAEIAKGNIKINQNLLKQFENSLIICDEFHNLYNSITKNNYGVAIQYILDQVPTVRAVFLSATPINNSPTEIIDIANFVLPPDQKIRHHDLFVRGKELKPDALDRIGKIFSKNLSFLQDTNMQYYPSREFIGERITIGENKFGFREIPYIKFVSADMSKFHQKILDEYLAENETDSIPIDGQMIFNMVLPKPGGAFWRSSNRSELATIPEEFLKEHEMQIIPGDKGVVSGPILLRKNIQKYSAKYAAMLDAIETTFVKKPEDASKIMIYHPRVGMSGVIMIHRILLHNGFIDEFSEPSDNTRCAICGVIKSNHTGHDYRPARALIVHSDINRKTMEKTITKYNLPSNAYGHDYKVIVGSQIIKESYEILDTQHLFIMEIPTNIPTMMQVLGRVVRKFSHIGLPRHKWRVYVRVFLHRNQDHSKVSIEERRYIEKMSDYLIIQKIERAMISNAIDSEIHRDIIMPEAVRKTYFPDASSTPTAQLGNLWFEPATKLPFWRLDELNLAKFEAFGHSDREVEDILFIIKRLFLQTPVWTYDGLWQAVRSPPFPLEVNPRMFSEYNFALALNILTFDDLHIKFQQDTVAQSANPMVDLVSKLRNRYDRFIHLMDTKYKIQKLGDYFIIFPVCGTRTIQDYDSFMFMNRQAADCINVGDYLSNVTADTYLLRRDNFIGKIKKVKDDPIKLMNCIMSNSAEFYLEFLQEIIKYNVLIELGKTSGVEPDLEEIYDSVLDFFANLNVIIYIDNILRYRDTARKITSKEIVEFNKEGKTTTLLPRGTPVGYVGRRDISIFNLTDWVSVDKVSMNRSIAWTENQHYVGYFEATDDGRIKFKLRLPLSKIQKIMAESKRRGDQRVLPKGMDCNTMTKEGLLNIVKELKITTSEKTIKGLCVEIKRYLIEREMEERKKDTRIKYVYFDHEELPEIRS